MSYVLSPSRAEFYPLDLRSSYEAAGTWPDDAIEVSDDDYRRLVAERPPNSRLLAVPGDLPILIQPELSAEQVYTGLVAAVQRHLDTAAAVHGYDDIKSAVTYAEEPVVERFQREGRAFREWRSLVWDACNSILSAVQSGSREVPTAEQIFADLPSLNIPPAPATEGE